ncbi:MAG TPA: histidine kinase N-terminal 7TM domain-containing protein, partial [Anaerolineales bacterium]|nr:histidine kinase N-terminal 7TM domain-containing protein [Anaerolineales bacterium]
MRRWARMFMHIGHVSHLTYSLLLILAALISLNVLLLALRRRHAPGAREMAIFSFALALWAGIYALHWLNFWQPRPLFWLDLTYLGVVLTPPAFLAFAIAYTDHSQLISRRLILALAVMPVLTLIF